MLFTVVSMPLQTIKGLHLTEFYEAPTLGKLIVVVFIAFLRGFVELGNHPKVFCMLGKYSSAKLHFQSANFILRETFLPPCYFTFLQGVVLLSLLETGFNKYTICQGRGMRIRKLSK